VVDNALGVLLLLQIYIDELKSETEEGTVVPEAIAHGAHRLQILLVEFRGLLPRDCANPSLYRRVNGLPMRRG
jgi:hypothetical protein